MGRRQGCTRQRRGPQGNKTSYTHHVALTGMTWLVWHDTTWLAPTVALVQLTANTCAHAQQTAQTVAPTALMGPTMRKCTGRRANSPAWQSCDRHTHQMLLGGRASRDLHTRCPLAECRQMTAPAWSRTRPCWSCVCRHSRQCTWSGSTQGVQSGTCSADQRHTDTDTHTCTTRQSFVLVTARKKSNSRRQHKGPGRTLTA